jgi:DnaJ-like protein
VLDKTLYEILEVAPAASQETIEAAYHSLLSRYDPDKVVGLGSEIRALAADRTTQLKQAYKVLSDASKRTEYDSHLRNEATNSSATASASTLLSVQSQSSAPTPRGLTFRHVAAIGVGIFVSVFLSAISIIVDETVNMLVSGDSFLAATEFHIFSSATLSLSGMAILFCMFIAWNYLVGFYTFKAGAYASRLIYPSFNRLLLFLGFFGVMAFAAMAMIIIAFYEAHSIADQLEDFAESAANFFGIYVAYAGKGLFGKG